MTSPAVTHRPRSAAIAEALGYAGGVLVLVGVVLVVAQTWDTLGSAGRVALAAAAGGISAGAAARVAPGVSAWGPGPRLRSTLWLVAVLSSALATGLVVHDVLGATSARAVISGGGAMAALVATVVWRGRVRPVEQALAWLALAVTAGALGAHLLAPGLSGAFAATIGLVALVAGVQERTEPSAVAVWCGGITLVVSCQMIAGQWASPGILLSLSVATGLILLSQLDGPVTRLSHITACAVTGSVLLAFTMPGGIGYHAARAGIATGLVVWATSVVLLVAAERPGLFRAPLPALMLAGVLFSVGPAVMSTQHRGVGVVSGLVVSTALVVFAVAKARVRLALVGSVGLLVYVPWTVTVLVPGALAAPVAIVVAGLVVVIVAAWLLQRRSVTPEGSATSTPSSRAPGDAE